MKRPLPWLTALLLTAAASAQETLPTTTANPTSALADSQVEQSNERVFLPFDLAGVNLSEDAALLVAQPLPGDLQFVPGSAQLDGRPLPDPVRGPSGTLYWTLTAQPSGELSFELSGNSALRSQLPAASLQLVGPQGRLSPVTGQVTASDWLSARPLPAPASDRENAGAIKLPLDGTDYATLDRITVVVEGPLGEPPVPLVNGVPARAEQVGKTVTDPERGVQRLEYFGLPIRPGVNRITLGGDTVTVRLAGPTTRYDIEPLQLVADGVTPLRLRIRTFDALGVATQPDRLTLQTNLAPLTPDAFPLDAGYQLALTGGEGLLELQPQGTPATLKLDLLENDRVVSRSFEVRPDARAVGVGMVSATVGLGAADTLAERFRVQARAYYEGPVGDGKLYVAADKDGLPTTTGTLPTNARNVNYGDASRESVPLQGYDPVALSYDHPRFRAEYRRSALPLTVLPVGESLTALTVTTKTAPNLSGFVAMVPKDRITDERLTPEGTRLLRLSRGNVAPGSQQLVLVNLGGEGTELGRKVLTEGLDYVFDPDTGIITLTTALSRVDDALHEQYVLASYRLRDGGQNRQLAYGAQVEHEGVAAQGRYRVGAAAAQLDGVTTFGVAGSYERPGLSTSARVMVSGGVLATAQGTLRPSQWAGQVATVPAPATFTPGGQFAVRYQSEGYAGLERGTPGLQARANYDQPLSQRLGLRVEADYGRPLDAAQSSGYVAARAVYAVQPFTVGAGVRYGFGTQQGLGVSGSVGYQQGPVSAEVVHTQPISGTLKAVSDFKVDYRIRQNVTLSLRDTYTWGVGNSGVIGLNTVLGRTNYTLSYETADSSGRENRARFGVSTTLPLTDRLGVGLRGSYLWNVDSQTHELSTGADFAYRAERYQATLGADVGLREGKLSTVVRGGLSGDLTDHLNVGADATAEFGVRGGQKLALGYAYRSGRLNSLGYVRYLAGSLSGGNDNVMAGFGAEYRLPPSETVALTLRGGADMRVLLRDRDTLTVQPYAGVTAAFHDRLQVGAWTRALIQPATGTQLIGYGVEAGVRALPGTWVNAGYNIKGFDGIDTAGIYTRQGAYVRFDLTLDETLNGAKK